MKEQLAQIGNRALNVVAYGAIATGIGASIAENVHEASVGSSVDGSMERFVKEHDDYHKQYPDSNTMPVGVVPNNYTEEMLNADPIETFRRGQEAKKSAEQEKDTVLWYGLSVAGVALRVFQRGRKLRSENKKLKTEVDTVKQQATGNWHKANGLIGALTHEVASYRAREDVFIDGILHFGQAAAINIPREVVDQARTHAYRAVPPVIRQQAPTEAAPAQAPVAQPQPERPPVVPVVGQPQPVAQAEAPQRQAEPRPTPVAPSPASNAQRWLRGRRQVQIPDERPPRREQRSDHDE